MTYTPVAPYVCHCSKPRCLQDTKRVVPMPWVHQPPVLGWLQVDPLPKPWVSHVSDETIFPAHFVTPSWPLLPPLCLLDSSVDVEGNPMDVMDPHLRHTNFKSILNHHPKYFFPNYTKIQKNEICTNIMAYLCNHKRLLLEVACLDLL
jgi:hypothetical protein